VGVIVEPAGVLHIFAMRLLRPTLIGALLLVGCRPATPPALTASPDSGPELVRQRVDTAIIVTGSPERLAAFHFDVPLPTDTGVCVRRAVPFGVGEMISVYHPEERNATALVSVNIDTAGHIIRFTDRRGQVGIHFDHPASAKELDSALAVARRTTRSSMLYLDYPMGRAMLSNEGGGRKTESVMAALIDVANDPRFDKPDARAHAILARCASTPLRSVERAPSTNRGTRPAGSSAYFEFQVEKPAFYAGGSDVSPHPGRSDTGALVQFVVDSAGAVRPETFKVLRARDDALVDDARKVLSRWRFLPAELNGRKVSQLVQTGIER
jgi:hypothetical protein